MDSWPACHEFDPSTAKDPPCRRTMHDISADSSNVLPLVWLGEGVPAQVLFSSTMVQNDEVRSQKSFNSRTVRRSLTHSLINASVVKRCRNASHLFLVVKVGIFPCGESGNFSLKAEMYILENFDKEEGLAKQCAI
ncbi:hypothetical protein TNCV_3104851 [Trichonephila clavipes]|nr:hypothetical protein TNCV_3104851 [Trichonephila clavipes]